MSSCQLCRYEREMTATRQMLAERDGNSKLGGGGGGGWLA